MKALEKHVPDLELCKQLSIHGWQFSMNVIWQWNNQYREFECMTVEERRLSKGYAESTGEKDWYSNSQGKFLENYPAPLATELLEELPEKIFGSPLHVTKYEYESNDLPVLWVVSYQYATRIERDNLADALAEMWIYLKENNHDQTDKTTEENLAKR